MIRTCAVLGHRDVVLTKELENKLFQTCENLIRQGCECFYFGGFGDFDAICHAAVSKLKANYPRVKRIFCLSDPRHLRVNKRPKWLKKENYEEIIYLNLDFDWWYTRIYFRNCAMIDNSDAVLFYVEKLKKSGAYKAFEYAKKRKKEILNLMTSDCE